MNILFVARMLRTLGITQATTEYSGPIAEMFKDMIGRGFGFDEGLLVVIDGGKGLAKAVGTVFGSYAVIQRGQVHKVANVLHHLSETDRKLW
jgi:transposase-like protein